MKNNLKYILGFALLIAITIFACKKTDYSFGKIKTPGGISVTATPQGVDATHPDGDGSGIVTVTITATDVTTYKVYSGDALGDSALSSTGAFTFTYATEGTNVYTIAVNAIGTGGAMSTVTKQVKVFYTFPLPADILAGLTNGSSQTWISAHDVQGHFGVGPAATFTADYYKAAPDEKPACAYDDEITFKKIDNNTVSITVDNKGETFLIGASVGYYGQTGSGDGCYPVNTGGTKTLGFGAAVSGSGAANSTGVQFTVPGNGIVDFGTGSGTYEILSLSAGVMMLRNIGIDGNAWYQILKVK